MDSLGVILLSGAFGLLVTAHVALLFALATRTPRWHAVFALLLPPLAPYWGIAERRYAWSALWIFAAIVYFTSLVAASF